MATLTAVKFPTAVGADEALQILERLQREEAIRIHDGAVVSWVDGAKKPKTRQLNHLAGSGALGGGFWGLLFGLIFFVPFLGMAVGAGMGALFGHLGKNAIDKQFQDQVRDMLKPGTSALFMVVEKVTPDKAVAALSQFGGTVLKTSLSDEDTQKLQEALHGSDVVVGA
jgi:uncharacterized membrane protein